MPKNSSHNRNIFVIGCGGNGSWFIQELIDNKDSFKDCNIYLIDFDKVDENNLSRQNFSIDDLQTYKSIALTKKLLNNGFKNPIPIINKDIEFDICPDFVFIFVDNMYARRYYFSKIYGKYGNNIKLWVDAGNGYYDGQIFSITAQNRNKSIPIYENFLETTIDDIDRKPCANMPEQNVFINKLMARYSMLLLSDYFKGIDIPPFIQINGNFDNIQRYRSKFYINILVGGYLVNDLKDIERIFKIWNKITEKIFIIYKNYIFLYIVPNITRQYKSLDEVLSISMFKNQVLDKISHGSYLYIMKDKVDVLSNGEGMFYFDFFKKFRPKNIDKYQIIDLNKNNLEFLTNNKIEFKLYYKDKRALTNRIKLLLNENFLKEIFFKIKNEEG